MMNSIKRSYKSILILTLSIGLLFFDGWLFAFGIIALVISAFVVYKDFTWWGVTKAMKKYG